MRNMSFLISIVIVLAIIMLADKSIKKYAVAYYIVTILLSILISIGILEHVPPEIRTYLIGIFQKGAFSTAILTVVMYMGILKNGTALKKKLMPIRGELSIIGCIMVLGHNIAYGKVYLVAMATRPEILDARWMSATIMTIILVIIMLPLFVTSFQCVRKKMKPKAWKKLQRLAYVFYMLIYVHVLILTIPFVQMGVNQYKVNLAVYTVVFVGYAVLRIKKYLVDKKIKGKGNN